MTSRIQQKVSVSATLVYSCQLQPISVENGVGEELYSVRAQLRLVECFRPRDVRCAASEDEEIGDGSVEVASIVTRCTHLPVDTCNKGTCDITKGMFLTCNNAY